ncbi:MAG: hypothetical protein WBQ14_11380 [Gaiellaceae bacterium]
MPTEGVVGRVKRRPRPERRAGYALLALVSLSALGHVIVSLSRASIVFLPDEYLYIELSRSISSTGLPLVRGSQIFFPSLLQPILTAPAWLFGSVATGFHASMAINSIAMSLAALPVYWLGRRLGLSPWLAFGASALALATPSMLYSSWLIAEAVAYPLFLAAFSAGVLALSGERRWLIPALVLFALASAARVQLLVLPVAFAIAAVLMAMRERRFRRFLAERRFLIGAGSILAVTALVIPASALGFYGGIRHVDLSPGRFALHFGTQAIGLLFASAWIIVPGALIGLGLAIARPRTRVELSFACSAAIVTLGLLLQASFFGVVTIPQERYLFYCAPILALSIALLADRGWPLRRLHALLVLPIIVLVAELPLSTYAVGTRLDQSSFLYAVFRLERGVGVGNASLIVALVVSTLAVATLALPFSRRLGAPGIFTLAIALSASAMAISVKADLSNGARIVREEAPVATWVDAKIEQGKYGGRAVLLQGYGNRNPALDLLFWNRSVDRVALLPDSSRPDVLPWPRATIGSDGSLSVEGKPLTGPLVIDGAMHSIRLRGVVKAGHSTTFTLWLPQGRPRLSSYAAGFGSGWIGPRAALALWPARANGHLAGFLSFRARAVQSTGRASLSLQLPGEAKRKVGLELGKPRLVRIAVCSDGPWRATIATTATRVRVSDSTLLESARASTPVWREDASACARSH